jgi:hypothetical protein
LLIARPHIEPATRVESLPGKGCEAPHKTCICPYYYYESGCYEQGAGNKRACAINRAIIFGTGKLSGMRSSYYVKNGVGVICRQGHRKPGFEKGSRKGVRFI